MGLTAKMSRVAGTSLQSEIQMSDTPQNVNHGPVATSALANCSAIAPPPHVTNKAPWVRAAAEDIIRTGFNLAFLYEEIGDVIAKHAAPLEAKYRTSYNALEEIVATRCDPRKVASAALNRCVNLSSPNAEVGNAPRAD